MSRKSWKARPVPIIILQAMVVLAIFFAASWGAMRIRKAPPNIYDFESCVAAGNPVLESYPEQCVNKGQSYINPAQNVPDPFKP